MSRFFSPRHRALVPYVPGEQPRDAIYVKLNTNESPFPPSPLARRAAAEAAERLQLYSDPTCLALRKTMAARLGAEPEELLFANGSDEVLNFAFLAFCDEDHPALFPDVTYGFYPVFAAVNRVPSVQIPLREDFSVGLEDYAGRPGVVFLANPNAPTGLALPVSAVETLLRRDPERLVVVDEAYVDFGGESCAPLVRRYDNLLVVQTFSKSRSMAGARLGFALGNPALIRDLDTVRNSVNPYNVNTMTMAAGIGALQDEAYTRANCRTIMENRYYLTREMEKLGFCLTDSRANFVFARHPALSGQGLYERLRAQGILVRHFTVPRIAEYNRITVGTMEQMDTLLAALREILEENKEETP